MKNILYLMALLLLTGCQEKELFNSQQGNVRVTAGFADTRTVFTEEGNVAHVSWEKGDAIGLVINEQTNLKYIAQNNGNETTFIGEEMLKASDGTQVYAYYPYAINTDLVIQTYEFQYYGEPISKYDFLYANGKIDNNSLHLQFHHLFALLKVIVPVTLLENRDRFVVTSTEYLCTTKGFRLDRETRQLYANGDSLKMTNCMLPDTINWGGRETITFDIAILPQSENAVLQFFSNDCLLTKKAPLGGLKAGHIYTLSITENETEVLNRQEREALIALYEATGGENWTRNDNWCSDKPVNEWYGIGSYFKGDRGAYVGEINLNNNNLSGVIPDIFDKLPGLVICLLNGNNLTGNIPLSISNLKEMKWFDISSNNLSGELPEGLSSVMSAPTFDISYNNFAGKIPVEITNHPNWSLHWPYIVDKNNFDLTDVIYPAPSFSVVDLEGNTITSNEYSKHELTVLYGWASWCGYSLAFNEQLIPLYNAYNSKGLEVIGFSTVCPYDDTTCNELIKFEEYITKSGIPWRNFSNRPHILIDASDSANTIGRLARGVTPDVFVVDKNGEIVFQSVTCDYSELPNFIIKHFGFLNLYTSTDYSHDGEVVTLQKATVGKGIDLVFIGEAFVDKDMEPGGKYEQKMEEAMEQYFSIEPYKTFRNRFNVYAVKVISPNAEFIESAQHRINENDEVCFEYAQKVPGISNERKFVSVVYNTTGSAGRSYTVMYSDGSFVGYMMEGVNNVLNHEVGGHGFAKLLDEYVEPGYESLTFPNDNKDVLDFQWENWGWGANVDWRNDWTTVKWSRLLNDSRYANEGLGLYEGAYLYGYGAYRPTENSMMRYNDGPFNAPSREQIYKTIMQLSEGDSWTYNYEEFVEYDAINRNAATTRALQTRPSETVRKEWQQRHRPPVFVKGTWHDAVKRKQRK